MVYCQSYQWIYSGIKTWNLSSDTVAWDRKLITIELSFVIKKLNNKLTVTLNKDKTGHPSSVVYYGGCKSYNFAYVSESVRNFSIRQAEHEHAKNQAFRACPTPLQSTQATICRSQIHGFSEELLRRCLLQNKGVAFVFKRGFQIAKSYLVSDKYRSEIVLNIDTIKDCDVKGEGEGEGVRNSWNPPGHALAKGESTFIPSFSNSQRHCP